MKKTAQRLVLFALLLGMLTGCDMQIGDSTIGNSQGQTTINGDADQAEKATNFTPPLENRMVTGNHYPLSNDMGTYIVNSYGSTITYYDFKTEKSMFLCVQPGCSHEDESCLSYQGTISDFAVYDGYWYTLSSDSDNSVKLIRTDPANNQRKTLCSFGDEGYTYSANNLVLSYGRAWFEITKTSLAPVGTDEDGYDRYELKNYLICVQLNSGDAVTYSGEEPSSKHQFLGGSATHAAMVHMWLDEEPMSFEEYLTNHPDSSYEEFLSYYAQTEFYNTRRQLLWVDLSSGSEQVICQDIRPSDLSCCYGEQLYYRTIDQSSGLTQIFRLDLATGESTFVWEDTWIINYYVLDQKLFCVTSLEDNSIEYYCIDLLSGLKREIDNNGQRETIYFGIYSETTDKFIGYASDGGFGRMAWISKEDFWKGQYENLVTLG